LQADPSTQELYRRAAEVYHQLKHVGRGATAQRRAASIFLALIQRDPNGQKGKSAKQMLQALVDNKVVFPDWNGHTGLSATAHATHAPAAQSASTRTRRRPVPPMWVSFSFSKPGLAVDPTFGGDGAAGAAVDKDRQASINKSGDMCRSNSQRSDWCGDGNGGTLEVCHGMPGTKWVALATSNDGTLEDWGDGEAVGYDDQNGANQNALANCGNFRCQIVWSQSVDCGELVSEGSAFCGPSSQGVIGHWIHVWTDEPNATYSNGDRLIFSVQGNEVAMFDPTLPNAIQRVELLPEGGSTYIVSMPTQRKNPNVNGGAWYVADLPFFLSFNSLEEAKEAQAYFKYHVCKGR